LGVEIGLWIGEKIKYLRADLFSKKTTTDILVTNYPIPLVNSLVFLLHSKKCWCEMTKITGFEFIVNL